MKKIKVAIFGVGNCAKSLIEGVAHYYNKENQAGVAFYDIGGYHPYNIEFSLAYDIDKRKVGKPLSEAIYSDPNCAMDIPYDIDLSQITGETIVKMGKIEDGVSMHMREIQDKEKTFVVSNEQEATQYDIIQDLQDNQIDIALLYLPVGSQFATEDYVECFLKAKVPFVNCIPEFIVSNDSWSKRIYEAGIPAIGDDMRSQLGASVMSQALQELFFNRGMKVLFHSQTNEGGNTDFLNMKNESRLKSKRISKENVIRSQNDLRDIPVPKDGIYAGPSAYIPYLKDNKVAHFRIEAEGFGGAPVIFDARLSVQDSPNSAGVVIDAIRYLKVAHEMGMKGSLRGPSAATQKTPPEQMMIDDAYSECKELSLRKWTENTLKNNR